MRLAAKSFLAVLAAVSLILGCYSIVLSHCEIPCGIYGDKTRIDLLYEDIATVEKSMNQIMKLEKESSINYNQLVRWIGNKEDHANKIQHVVTQYFMTQRVKPSAKNYVDQLTSLHQLMVHAMKAKQTTDHAHCTAMRAMVDKFAAAYFNAEDLKHIRSHHASEGK